MCTDMCVRRRLLPVMDFSKRSFSNTHCRPLKPLPCLPASVSLRWRGVASVVLEVRTSVQSPAPWVEARVGAPAVRVGVAMTALSSCSDSTSWVRSQTSVVQMDSSCRSHQLHTSHIHRIPDRSTHRIHIAAYIARWITTHSAVYDCSTCNRSLLHLYCKVHL